MKNKATSPVYNFIIENNTEQKQTVWLFNTHYGRIPDNKEGVNVSIMSNDTNKGDAAKDFFNMRDQVFFWSNMRIKNFEKNIKEAGANDFMISFQQSDANGETVTADFCLKELLKDDQIDNSIIDLSCEEVKSDGLVSAGHSMWLTVDAKSKSEVIFFVSKIGF